MSIINVTRLSFLLILIQCANSLPPACFLSCIAEVSRNCGRGLSQLSCVCIKEDEIVGCLIDICPFGNFNSARDHFLGTCLEHGKPTLTNLYPPPAAWPPPDYEKNLPIMHEPVYRPEPTRSRVVDTGPTPTHRIIDHHNPPVSPPTPHTPDLQQPPDEPLTQDGPTRRPQHQLDDLHTPSPMLRPRPATQPVSDFDPWFDEYDDDFTDSYDPERPLEWEEMDALDRLGRFIVVRRPINVPKQLRDPSNAGKIRRVVVRGPVDKHKQSQTPIYETRKLVEKSDLNKELPAGENEKLVGLPSSVVLAPQEVHPETPLEYSSLASENNHHQSTPSIPKLESKRIKKTNRKTSPF